MTADEIEALIHLVYGDRAIRQLLTEARRVELMRNGLHEERLKAWATSPDAYVAYVRKLAEHIAALMEDT